jgi:Tol biopolymer transport system component
VNLTRHAAADGSPAWPPDGSRIAFVFERSLARPYGISIVNADGTGLVRLTDSSSDYILRWRPRAAGRR